LSSAQSARPSSTYKASPSSTSSCPYPWSLLATVEWFITYTDLLWQASTTRYNPTLHPPPLWSPSQVPSPSKTGVYNSTGTLAFSTVLMVSKLQPCQFQSVHLPSCRPLLK